jgi:hypothetical protein
MGLEYVPFLFLDDDRIFRKSREQHWNPLRALFSILDTIGLAFNQEKCVFVISELDFLVHRISATGVRPPPEQRPERTA